jgi:ABC-type phosphate transport system substrate-binding protein
VALAVVATLAVALAASGGAVPPPAGVNCAADGKFSGRGATFQKRAQDVFIQGFQEDVCGVVADTASGNGMAQYNVYDGITAPVLTGSGYGRKATMCRTDAFAGTDVPYNMAQLAAMNGDPQAQSNRDVILGAGNNCQAATGTGFGTSFTPPYQPINGSAGTTSYPNGADVTAPLMSFPVAGSAVAIGINLKGAGICTGTPPTTIQLTRKAISLLFGGDILNWNDSRLRESNTGVQNAINASLANCPGAVTRVVRLDDSGTTQIFKNYLQKIDGSRTNFPGPSPLGYTCDTGTTWTALAAASPNRVWPGLSPQGPTTEWGAAATTSCSAIYTGDVNGNNGVLDVCNGVVPGQVGVPPSTVSAPIAGAICYADLPDLTRFSFPTGSTAGTCNGTPCPISAASSVRNGDDTSYQPALAVGGKANCSFGGIVPPGGGTAGAVGLTAGDSWATNNTLGNHGDVTNLGAVYPICGVTFDLVYSGLGNGSVANAISELNADQRRAMYSYFTYITSSTGQARLPSAAYQSLSASLASQIQQGFQAAF